MMRSERDAAIVGVVLDGVPGDEVVVVGSGIVADQDAACVLIDQIIGHRGVCDATQVNAFTAVKTLTGHEGLPDAGAYRPSSGEGFGIAFLEAMACGTPALGLAAGGTVDALADGELGTLASEAEFAPMLARLLVTPKPDPQALAAAVRSRFGYAAFSRQVRDILAPVLRDNAEPTAPAYEADLYEQPSMRSIN